MEWTEEGRAWVEALESGLYPQGKGKLLILDEDQVTPKGFCCLGVGGALLGRLRMAGECIGSDYSYAVDVEHHASVNDVSGWLSIKTARRLGFTGSDSSIMEDQRHLGHLNDHRRPFTEIANVIRIACDNEVSIGTLKRIADKAHADDGGADAVWIELSNRWASYWLSHSYNG